MILIKINNREPIHLKLRPLKNWSFFSYFSINSQLDPVDDEWQVSDRILSDIET